MTEEKDEIIEDPLTDTQRKLRAVVVEAMREVLQEERKRFDWLKFVSSVAGYVKGEIDKRTK